MGRQNGETHHGGSSVEAKAGLWDFRVKCMGYRGEREPRRHALGLATWQGICAAVPAPRHGVLLS